MTKCDNQDSAIRKTAQFNNIAKESTITKTARSNDNTIPKQRQHTYQSKQRQHDTEDREENMIIPKITVEIPKNTADATTTARWQRQHDGKDSTMAKTARWQRLHDGKDCTMAKTVP